MMKTTCTKTGLEGDFERESTKHRTTSISGPRLPPPLRLDGHLAGLAGVARLGARWRPLNWSVSSCEPELAIVAGRRPSRAIHNSKNRADAAMTMRILANVSVGAAPQKGRALGASRFAFSWLEPLQRQCFSVTTPEQCL